MTKDEVLRLALEYLEESDNYLGSLDHSEPIAAIKEALAQPEPDPVELKVYKGEICYLSKEDNQSYGMWCPVNYDTQHGFEENTKFYTTPPQRTWVGLTDEEANQLWESTDSDWELMKRTEAKLKDKNI